MSNTSTHFQFVPQVCFFSGLTCAQPAYLQLWRALNPDPTDPEVIRNYPVRQPLLWFPQQAQAAAASANKRT